MAASNETVEITAQCLCKESTFKAAFDKSSFPLKAFTCHCTSCRRVMGALYSSAVIWPEATLPPNKLQAYPFTKNMEILSCPTCSAKMFWQVHYPDQPVVLEVFTGVLPHQPLNLVSYDHYNFISNTRDGGAMPFFKSLNLVEKQEEADSSAAFAISRLPEVPLPDGVSLPDKVPIQCHCGGVQLQVKRFTEADRPADGVLPKRVDPVSLKYLASLDACDSCRLHFGVELVNWLFPPMTHVLAAEAHGGGVLAADTHELDKMAQIPPGDPRRAPALGTLQLFRSSPDVQRYACSCCGASIFFACDSRVDMIDLALGVVDASDGARAESVGSWAFGKIAYAEDGDGGWREPLLKSILDDSEQYRRDRGYPRCWLLPTPAGVA